MFATINRGVKAITGLSGKSAMGIFGGAALLTATAGLTQAAVKSAYRFPDFRTNSLTTGIRGIDSPMYVSEKIMHTQSARSRVKRMIR